MLENVNINISTPGYIPSMLIRKHSAEHMQFISQAYVAVRSRFGTKKPIQAYTKCEISRRNTKTLDHSMSSITTAQSRVPSTHEHFTFEWRSVVFAARRKKNCINILKIVVLFLFTLWFVIWFRCERISQRDRIFFARTKDKNKKKCAHFFHSV